jgi:hypothetical protein
MCAGGTAGRSARPNGGQAPRGMLQGSSSFADNVLMFCQAVMQYGRAGHHPITRESSLPPGA